MRRTRTNTLNALELLTGIKAGKRLIGGPACGCGPPDGRGPCRRLRSVGNPPKRTAKPQQRNGNRVNKEGLDAAETVVGANIKLSVRKLQEHLSALNISRGTILWQGSYARSPPAPEKDVNRVFFLLLDGKDLDPIFNCRELCVHVAYFYRERNESSERNARAFLSCGRTIF